MPIVSKFNDFLSRKPLLVSLLINAVLFTIIYLAYTWHFRTNDDMGMLLRAAGVSKVTEPSAFILYSNIIIGWVLSMLYQLSLSIPWYALYMTASMFVAHVVILYVVLRKVPNWVVLVWYLFFFWLVTADMLIGIQFTMTASLVTLAGFVLLFFDQPSTVTDKLSVNEWLTSRNILAVFLIVFGCMIRWRAMVMITIAMLPVIAIYSIKKPIPLLVQKAGVLAMALLLSFGAYSINSFAYKQDPGWAKFHKHKPIAMKFVNDRLLEYIDQKQAAKLIKEANWTFNDYQMFVGWFFMSEELYGLPVLEKMINNMPPQKNLTLAIATKEMKRIMSGKFALRCAVLFGLALVLLRFNWRNILTILVIILAVTALLYYVIFFYKSPPQRVFMPLFSLVALSPFLLWNSKGFISIGEKNWWRIVPFIIMIGLACWVSAKAFVFYAEESDNYQQGKEWLHKAMKSFKPSPKNLYVVWGQGYPWKFITPFDDITFLRNFNTFGLGTGQHSPSNKKMLQKFGITDLYQDLVYKDNVFLMIRNQFIEKRLPLYHKFMRQHYNLRTTEQKVLKSSVFTAYKILPQ